MPFLNEQINIVNNSLLTNAFADKRFKAGRFETIAVDVSRKNDNGVIETLPAVMDNNYQAREITVTDTWPIIVYHKVAGKRYSFEKGNFGNVNLRMVEQVQMKMVVYGKYAALKMTKEQLEALITTNFPDNISTSSLAPLSLDSMLVTLQGSNLVSAQVFNEEYKGFPLFLAPEDIFFSISYQIETRFRKGCFNICDCV
jgi:hypothetical protein